MDYPTPVLIIIVIIAALVLRVITLGTIQIAREVKERNKVLNLLNSRSAVNLDDLAYAIASSEAASSGCDLSKIRENLIFIADEFGLSVEKIRAEDRIADLIKIESDLIGIDAALAKVLTEEELKTVTINTVGELVLVLAREKHGKPGKTPYALIVVAILGLLFIFAMLYMKLA